MQELKFYSILFFLFMESRKHFIAVRKDPCSQLHIEIYQFSSEDSIREMST